MLAPRKRLHSTPTIIITQALALVDVQEDDIFYDIGCGDGRCVIAVAQTYGIRAVGIEIDQERAQVAQLQVDKLQLNHLITIQVGNALEKDISEATIIFLFLIERGLRLLQPKLEAQIARTRVITYLYKFPTLQFQSKHYLRAHEVNEDITFPIFLYEFPTSA